jgi:protein tyrosine/serine phosphatase
VLRDRTLTWDGCVNVRDLGGHRTEDGKTTRFGAVVRADCVRRLSSQGWAALVDYGIRTIIDLRVDSELQADPPGEVPLAAVHIPLLPDVHSPFWADIDHIRRRAASSPAGPRDVYLEFLRRYPANFARAVSAVGAAEEGGVLVHCQGGKDRTGLVCGLLLRLAGVGVDDVAADYALSAENLARQLDESLAGTQDEEERELTRAVFAGPPAAMKDVLEDIERRHGSVREYLLAGGARASELDRVRSRLV